MHEVEDVINSYPDVKESWSKNLSINPHCNLQGTRSLECIGAVKLPKTPTGKLDLKALHLKAEAEAKLDNNDRHQ